MTITLGFDVGTSRTKGVIFDHDVGATVALASVATPVVAGGEHDRRDPAALVASLTELCGDLLGQGAPLDQVAGVSLASLGEEVVLVDRRGECTGPVACWYVEQVPEIGEPTVDVPLNKAASWYALRSAHLNDDPIFGDAVSFADLGSYLLLQMTGNAKPFIDRTHASRTGLLDGKTGGWSADRLRSCGLETMELPLLVDSGTRVGDVDPETAVRLHIPAGIPVRAGAHDHLCAALASGVRSPGDMFLSIGTSETQLLIVDASWEHLVSLERADVEVGFFTSSGRKYLHRARPSGRRVADLISADTTGRSIGEIYEALSKLCRRDSERKWTLPDGATDLDATAAGLFTELVAQAQECARTVAAFEAISGAEVSSIAVAGVPVQHEIWRDIRTQYSMRPLQFVNMDEPSAVGVAKLALGENE